MNTIERVARAIRRSQYSPELWEPEEIESMVEEGASDFDRIAASAAIEALREPDEAHFDAGRDVAPAAEGYDLPGDIPRVWNAILDSILNTDTGEG